MALNLELPSFTARQARPSLIVGGKDILATVAMQNILTFNYTDNTSDKADDLSISLADPRRTWMQSYLPDKGAQFEAYLKISNWTTFGDTRTLKCGTFFVDQVEMQGPPNFVSFRASSIPRDEGIKDQKKNRAWEDSKLQDISGQIAQENGLTLFYDTTLNPVVKRTDQCDKTDLEYIRERAKENALSIKIHDKKLVVFSEKEYEQRAAIFILKYGATNILSYSFSSKCDDTYKSAENSYVNPETGKLTTSTFTPSNPPQGAGGVLKSNERVEFRPDGSENFDLQKVRIDASKALDYTLDAPAQNAGKGEGTKEGGVKKCESKLRDKNKKERQATVRVVGDIKYVSGLNCQLVGWGIFDGKWFIESSSHDINEGGYEIDLHLRTALEGY